MKEVGLNNTTRLLLEREMSTLKEYRFLPIDKGPLFYALECNTDTDMIDYCFRYFLSYFIFYFI